MNKTLLAISVSLILSHFVTLPAQAASPVVTPMPAVAAPPAVASPAAQSKQPSAASVSVLERFRTYKGPRTPAAMKALFVAPVAADLRQQPEVVVSDGASTVRISIIASPTDSKAPNVAFSGAQLISLKRSKADEWELEARPEVGVLKATLILLNGAATREIPLTVAPTLPKEIDLTELGFAAFLRGTGSPPQPEFDLNDDGHRDYVDDYIFTANHLARPHVTTADPGDAQPAEPNPPFSDGIVEQQTAPDPATGELSQPPDRGQSFTSQGAYSSTPGSTSGQTPVPQVQSGSQQGTTAGQAPVPPTQPTTPTTTPTTKPPETTAGQTSYQRNLAIRNQRLREMRERLKAPAITPTP